MRRTEGSISLLTLMMISVLLGMAISFNWYVREHLRNIEALKTKTGAFLEAHSTSELINYLLITGQLTNQKLILPKIPELWDGTPSIPLDGTPFSLTSQEVMIRVWDTNGLISLHPVNEDGLRNLLTLMGEKRANELIECYYDWIDTDKLKRLTGAEEKDYSDAGLPFGPRNYPLQYKREFMLIKGFSRELYKKIEPFVTLLPVSGFNPNTAPPEVLMAVLEVNNETAQRIRRYIREVRPVTSENQLTLLAGKTVILSIEYSFMPSGFFEIEIRIPEGNRTKYLIKYGLRKLGTKNAPYMITHWMEE